MPTTDGALVEGAKSFLAALRAAGAEAGIRASGLTAALLTAAGSFPSDGEPVSKAEPLGADEAPVQSPSGGATVETEAMVFVEALGMPCGGGIPIQAAAEACALIPADPMAVVEVTDEAGATEASGRSDISNGIRPYVDAGAAEQPGVFGTAADQVEQAAGIAGKMPAVRYPQVSGHVPQASLDTAPAAKTAAPHAEGHLSRIETGAELEAGTNPEPAATEKAAAPVFEYKREPSEAASDVMRARMLQRANEAGQFAGRSLPAVEPLTASSRTAADVSPVAGTTDPAVIQAHALRSTLSPEGSNGHTASDPSRSGETPFDRGEAVPEHRTVAEKDSSDFRQPAEDLLGFKMASAGKAATAESEVFAEALAASGRDALPSATAERSLEKSADGSAVVHDREAGGATGRAGVFDQIVHRAAVHLKDDQGEISIDLKPDFLGRVRMQVTTENQQVTVRIFTELPSVRDMIETGLPQLKSELQSQGLQVERLEVAVADDHRQRDWQQPHTAHGWKGAPGSADAAANPQSAEQPCEIAYRRPQLGGAPSNIDMFV